MSPHLSTSQLNLSFSISVKKKDRTSLMLLCCRVRGEEPGHSSAKARKPGVLIIPKSPNARSGYSAVARQSASLLPLRRLDRYRPRPPQPSREGESERTRRPASPVVDHLNDHPHFRAWKAPEKSKSSMPIAMEQLTQA